MMKITEKTFVYLQRIFGAVKAVLYMRQILRVVVPIILSLFLWKYELLDQSWGIGLQYMWRNQPNGSTGEKTIYPEKLNDEEKLQCANIPIYSRSDWRAKEPKYSYTIPTPVPIVFIHHTAQQVCNSIQTCSEELRTIQDLHMNENRWADIGYSFMVDQGGNIYEARGWDKEGAHTTGYNGVSISISFFGNFMNIKPSKASLDAVQSLIECGVRKGYISEIYKLCAHRDACPKFLGPGDYVYNVVRTWPRYDVCKPMIP